MLFVPWHEARDVEGWGWVDMIRGGRNLLGDEGINLAKLLQHILDQLLALLVLADIALVCLSLDAVLLGELLDVLLSALLSGGVCDGNVCAHLSAAPCGLDAHALGA